MSTKRGSLGWGLLLSASALCTTGCVTYRCCEPPGGQPPAGTEQCVEAKLASFDFGACKRDCQEKTKGCAHFHCKHECTEVAARLREQAELQCFGDADGDGIQDPGDACPGTPPEVATNWKGCPDADGDFVPDGDDHCPGSPPGQLVDLEGCETEVICHEGQCGEGPPHCMTEEECDLLVEVPIEHEVPREVLDASILKELSRRPHPVLCPDDRTPPPQPLMLAPASGIHPIEVGHVSVTLIDGEVVDGDSIAIPLAWSEVDDECPPVTYSIYIQYYHCHHLAGLIEPASYRNRGWCRWVPYLYRSVSSSSLALDFPMGKVLYEIHKPFIPELGWNPDFTGTFPMSYMPFWLSVQVYAHDGNGTASGSGLHGDHRYLVLYSDDSVPLDLLNQIPVAP